MAIAGGIKNIPLTPLREDPWKTALGFFCAHSMCLFLCWVCFVSFLCNRPQSIVECDSMLSPNLASGSLDLEVALGISDIKSTIVLTAERVSEQKSFIKF